MSNFEYLIVHLSDGEQEKHLNDLGSDGWELISVVSALFAGSARFYFKRIKGETHISTNAIAQLPKGSAMVNAVPKRKVTIDE